MTIIPNLSAQTPPDEFAARETLSKSLSRLSSGGSVAPPAGAATDSPLGLALNSQSRRIDDAQQQVSNAVSFTQTQAAYLTKISETFDRMSELAGLAQGGTISSAERSQYQNEFSQISASITSASNKDFNGTSLFSGNSFEVALDPNGNTLSLPGVSLNQSVYTEALQANLNSVSDAQDALGKLKSAGQQLRQDRAGVEADQARLYSAADRLAVSKENLNAATSGIQDMDAAEESAQSARAKIVAQPGAAMLSQANATPQSALRLLP